MPHILHTERRYDATLHFFLLYIYHTVINFQLGLTRRARRWKWKTFVNHGRNDDLQLLHWEREDGTHDVYPFSRFNKVGFNFCGLCAYVYDYTLLF